ncbi:MAG: inosine monophosphate cyclohydrolase [Clostridia bacterium]|nr:inosine monophosphate cyclohydrolase [Clostridia bacterium]
MNKNKIQRVGTLLGKNDYPGRGIIVGKSKNGRNAVFVYFITSMSENGKNSVIVEQGDEVVVHTLNASPSQAPTTYSSVKAFDSTIIVSNGDHTDTVFRSLSKGESFMKSLESRRHETDAPNFTPRICAVAELNGQSYTYKFAILKSGNENGTVCQRNYYCYEPENGLGHFIRTYKCAGIPTPAFDGEPERVKIPDDINAFTNDIWENLDSEIRVSLYVRYVDLATGKSESRTLNRNAVYMKR